MNNYRSRYKIQNEKNDTNELLQKLYQIPELKTILGNIEKSQKKDFDNWDFLIEQYMNNIDFEISKGYEEIKKLMIENYGEPILDFLDN